ncbi:MAG TPA: sialidase family protein [Candidatus Thermoplasmatota archaeon]|nr:sialidase family protein [Candidatus Thermoplasmatota archaeon]
MFLLARTPILALVTFALAAPALAGCFAAEDGAPAAVADGPLAPALADGVMAVVSGVDGPVAAVLNETTPLVVPALYPVGSSAFEPTLGVAPDGAIYYGGFQGNLLVGFIPTVMKSTDGGKTWTDVSPKLPTGHGMPPETNDPYLYVDPATGRVFQFAMAPILVCAPLSWTDDGGQTWTTNPRGCGTVPPWDHQTMVAAKPRMLPTLNYPNVLHQCVNQIATSQCSRSLDGGLTWSNGQPASLGVEPEPPSAERPDAGFCGGLHGHVVAAPDGTVYLPKVQCGKAIVSVSRDDGTTWESVTVTDVEPQASADPAVAVDDAGNVYYLLEDVQGALWLTTSVDAGRTWSTAVRVTPPGLTAHIPAIAAGAAGRIAIAFPGTTSLSAGYDSPDKEQDKAVWGAYIAVSVDALSPTPLFQIARVNEANDTLVSGRCGPGRCPGFLDFIDVVIGPDGRPYAAFVDACESNECKNGDNDDAAAGVMGTLLEGPLLRDVDAAPPAS